VLVVLSDTHGADGHRLRDRALAAVREADLVVHAGDLTTETVLDALHEEADRLLAVSGNRDDPGVADRLPAARTFEYGGVRFALTHTRRGGATALSLFGRERDADVVVFGHSHRPTVTETEGPTLLNPGSHADPRGNRPAYAEVVEDSEGLRGRLRTPAGESVETFRLEPGG
jgi:putative phosphoesterase